MSYRCSACQKTKKRFGVMIPWYRRRRGVRSATAVMVCRSCAAQQRDDETGRAFCIRMDPRSYEDQHMGIYPGWLGDP